jgi:hypothetical protein
VSCFDNDEDFDVIFYEDGGGWLSSLRFGHASKAGKLSAQATGASYERSVAFQRAAKHAWQEVSRNLICTEEMTVKCYVDIHLL